jgi:D-alanine-D-alanine ligase
MKIGITFDLKSEQAPGSANLPDDHQEEFDSPGTIDALADVLRQLGHDVVALGNGRPFLQRVLADPPDLVFNVAEGEGVGRCREARVPAVLEMLGIPHTGSDALTLAAALDKDVARRLAAEAGVAVPAGGLLQEGWSERDWSPDPRLRRFPVIVKPAWEGSSKGIRAQCLVEGCGDFAAAARSLGANYRQPVLVEEFIEGDELTVGLVGNGLPELVGIMQVLPRTQSKRFVYSLEVKRDFLRQVRYECPPRLPEATLRAVESAARTVWGALGCRDVARIDFRLRDGVPYFLEINPLPGLNPETSDLVIMAKLAGWTYAELIQSILAAAQARLGREAPVR